MCKIGEIVFGRIGSRWKQEKAFALGFSEALWAIKYKWKEYLVDL
jgi:hypothetical protein